MSAETADIVGAEASDVRVVGAEAVGAVGADTAEAAAAVGAEAVDVVGTDAAEAVAVGADTGDFSRPKEMQNGQGEVRGRPEGSVTPYVSSITGFHGTTPRGIAKQGYSMQCRRQST